MGTLVCSTSIAGLIMSQPRIPSDGAALPNFLLQDFAWTWPGMRDKMSKRRAMVAAGGNPELANVPIFCMQTAIKTLYWSALIYRGSSHDKQAAAPAKNKVRSSTTADAGRQAVLQLACCSQACNLNRAGRFRVGNTMRMPPVTAKPAQ